jgi:transcriptional regulator with XRE-family HTH domain
MPDSIYATIGLAIRSRRDLIGMTQASLAEKTGLSRTSVTNIERGGQALLVHQLLEIARALRVSPTSLLPSSVPAANEKPDQSVPEEMQSLLRRLEDSPRRRSR